MDMRKDISTDHIGAPREAPCKHGTKSFYYHFATKAGQLPVCYVVWKHKWWDTQIIGDQKESNAQGLLMSEAPETESVSPKDTAWYLQASSSIHHCPLHHSTYSNWNTLEAIQLFNTFEKESDVKESFLNVIEILLKANITDISYLEGQMGKK
jgi:hypothetical protein